MPNPAPLLDAIAARDWFEVADVLRSQPSLHPSMHGGRAPFRALLRAYTHAEGARTCDYAQVKPVAGLIRQAIPLLRGPEDWGRRERGRPLATTFIEAPALGVGPSPERLPPARIDPLFCELLKAGMPLEEHRQGAYALPPLMALFRQSCAQDPKVARTTEEHRRVFQALLAAGADLYERADAWGISTFGGASVTHCLPQERLMHASVLHVFVAEAVEGMRQVAWEPDPTQEAYQQRMLDLLDELLQTPALATLEARCYRSVARPRDALHAAPQVHEDELFSWCTPAAYLRGADVDTLGLTRAHVQPIQLALEAAELSAQLPAATEHAVRVRL